MKIVKFIANHQPYVAGEEAAFDDAEAADLVAKGKVAYVDAPSALEPEVAAATSAVASPPAANPAPAATITSDAQAAETGAKGGPK